MKVSELRFFVGVNLYLDNQVCRLRLEADQPGESVVTPVPAILLRRWMQVFPQLQEVLETINPVGVESSHAGHVLFSLIEMAAAELGWMLTYKKVVSLPDRGGLDLLFSYEERQVTTLTVNYAQEVLKRLTEAKEVDREALASIMNREHKLFLQKAVPLSRNIDTRYLYQSARERDIPITMGLSPDSLILGQGRYQKRLWKKTTPGTSWVAFHLAQYKPHANIELRRVGLPVADQVVVNNRETVPRAARQLGFPLVAKPSTTDMGIGITIGIQDERSLLTAFDTAKQHSPMVLLENFIDGDEYRLLVINGKFVAAAHRISAHVTGDGRHTIRELVNMLHRDPRRGVGKQSVLGRIELDQEAEAVLAKAGYTIDGIPPAGKQVFLRGTSNLSRGGTCVDVTSDVHPDNQEMALLAAKVIGLDIAGIDYITTDITRSWKETGGKICEINPSPGLRMHHSPTEGEPHDVAGPIFEMLFPAGEPSRIPVAVVTGSNGKTTTTRMSTHILRHSGACVGMTSTSGVYVDDELVHRGDLSGGSAAQQLLIDPRIDAAVLEIARGAILKWGTGIDSCDVMAVTNVADEHIGELGVQSREEMAKVKGLLVELARKMVILGADDPLTAALSKRSRADRVCYFSMMEENPLVAEHIASGHPALRLEQVDSELWMVLYDNSMRHPLLAVTDLPASLGGAALYNIENAMCAAAIAYGLDQELESIVESLGTFQCDASDNPGRMTTIDGFPFRVVVDHCLNPSALAAVEPAVRKIDGDRRFLVYSMTGNRRDADYSKAMQVVAGDYDEYHLYTTDHYLRNRTAGELTDLLTRGLLDEGVSRQAIFVHASEDDAVTSVLGRAGEDDLVFISSWNYEMTFQHVKKFIQTG
ncbi:hypothetical protein BOV90_07715 [Solemya velum gill symbiont]|uniref:ATP-grasp domain-containing protein n=2 Tax=Solemya velum gill symbiont TaxID=2340 RepID=A0A1T2CNU3_SOVGS|nr:Mur ligase family protein [Solemya velum gill symbiont]OOY33890.1 hypothetical protein BOV88_12835 [Solemya velum gill symbiont]OOY36545.1 hypothetical protein BOV89_11975 [Solemya velum gill symbiont]OOY39739.1 hypothetical protein BOV90_07715 [Solemya velum gill symbiont]OOY45784.1 hypothetical protein BOV93_12200 [Solemya velum gill symbiont]OOY49311.1 hypothetical protein BOV94_11420 [Solemya velum gill symbiont]